MTPLFKGDGHTTIQIQALNKLHQLTRGRQSKTYQDKTDQQILNEVLGKYGLSLDWKHDANITYKHVYQHNLSDLEFVRMRAARLGCHVWCIDTKVMIKQPDLGESQPLKLAVTKDSNSDTEAVRWFLPEDGQRGGVEEGHRARLGSGEEARDRRRGVRAELAARLEERVERVR